MPSIDTDTRLIMTILFVGAISGTNIYFYTIYGVDFPYTGLSHAVLFGICTVGGIMLLKALFDLMLNDMIEDFLLQRKIDAYWNRKARAKRTVKELENHLEVLIKHSDNLSMEILTFLLCNSNRNSLMGTQLAQPF